MKSIREIIYIRFNHCAVFGIIYENHQNLQLKESNNRFYSFCYCEDKFEAKIKIRNKMFQLLT
jgi:hypothetical protein